MSIHPGDYRREEVNALLRMLEEQVKSRRFQEGNRPHRLIDDGYSAEGKVFDTLYFVNTSTITYTNSIDGYQVTTTGIAAGTYIFGEFADSSITVAAGGLVIGYEK